MRSMARISPVGFLSELVGAVAGTDGDRQRIAVRLFDEVGGLVRSVSSCSRVMWPSAPWPSSLSPFIVSSEPSTPSSASTETRSHARTW